MPIHYTYIHTYEHLLFKNHIYVIHTYILTTSTLSDLHSLKYTYIHAYIHTYIHTYNKGFKTNCLMLYLLGKEAKRIRRRWTRIFQRRCRSYRPQKLANVDGTKIARIEHNISTKAEGMYPYITYIHIHICSRVIFT